MALVQCADRDTALPRMKVLTADEARQLWPVLEPAITLALSRQGPPSPLFQGELFRAIFTGQAKVLQGTDGYGVCYIDGDVCNLAAYTGTLREILLLKDEFMALAKQAGCRTIRITGDPAWMRVVKGLRQRCVVMELPI